MAKGNQTPLHYAAGNDAVNSLRVLVREGANKEARDYKLRTPLFAAAELGLLALLPKKVDLLKNFVARI